MTDWKDIKAMAFDVDGVFTDGSVLCLETGELFRTFDSKDGLAVRLATMKMPVAIITGGRSQSITKRFAACGVPAEDVYLHSRDKIEEIDSFCKAHGLERKDLLYAGDDLPDVEAIAEVGIGACPADAVDEVKAVADYISEKAGGKCFVRELIEKVLGSQGLWSFDVESYKKNY